MTDRDARRRLVGASVVLVSSLAFAGSHLVVAHADAPVSKPNPPEPQLASAQAPVRGLVPAAPPRRRVVTIRRTRAS